jgi:hypothetical protein
LQPARHGRLPTLAHQPYQFQNHRGGDRSAPAISPVHEAQLLTYLKLTGAPLGLLINFNVPVLHKGVKRMLNKAHEIVDEFNPIEKRRLAADE